MRKTQKKQVWAEEMAQEVECLASKHKDLILDTQNTSEDNTVSKPNVRQ